MPSYFLWIRMNGLKLNLHSLQSSNMVSLKIRMSEESINDQTKVIGDILSTKFED